MTALPRGLIYPNAESLAPWQVQKVSKESLYRTIGPCPRCGDTAQVDIPTKHLSDTASVSADDGIVAAGMMLCNCDSCASTVTGTAERIPGCGARWPAQVQSARINGVLRFGLVPVAGAAEAAALMVAAEQDTFVRTELPRMAGQWASGLLTFIGALGLGSTFAVSTARSLDPAWRTIAFVLLVGALAAAGSGAYCALTAAHGRLRTRDSADFQHTAEANRRKDEWRIGRVRRAQLLAGGASALFVSATALLWFAPTA